MLRRFFIVIILFLLAGIGIYAIMRLSDRAVPVKQGESDTEEESEKNEESKSLIEIFNFGGDYKIEIDEAKPGSTILLKSVVIESSGFVVAYDEKSTEPKNVLGYSKLLPKGTSSDVVVHLKRDTSDGEIVYLGFRIDDGDGYFEISGKYDKNVTRADGTPIIEQIGIKK